MQSGYGVSEIPQFLVDGLCSPLFPSPADQHPPPHHHAASAAAAAPPFHFYHFPHQLQQFYHHVPPQQQPVPAPMSHLDAARFAQFHPVPITQQLFEQTHQFHLFEQQQRRGLHAHLGLDHDSPPPPPQASAQPASAAPPPPFMSFRLAVNEASGGGGGASRDGLEDEDSLLPADDEAACESRMDLWAAPPPLPRQREVADAIKEPFWRPLDIDYMNRNNKRCKEAEATAALEQQSPPKHLKETEEVPPAEEARAEEAAAAAAATNYKLFSELEAICKPGPANNTTGSSSALTGDNPNPSAAAAPLAAPAEFPADHASNASTGEDEGSLRLRGSSSSRKARRRRRRRQQFSCIAAFFESLMKQLMDHQEALHQRFLEVLENRDRERARKEQQWWEQEAARTAGDASARAEQSAVAAAREAAIVTFLEKITGKPLNLPSLSQFECEEDLPPAPLAIAPAPGPNTGKKPAPVTTTTTTATDASDEICGAGTSSNRWPKAEVQALIKVRSVLEARFQEPGLKGPLWEEVSAAMTDMGYRRSAKRCKEKWENINKYFRKAKESTKKRPRQSKTCPYFHQLDQLYSKGSAAALDVDRRGNSELLDAIVVAQQTAEPSAAQSPDAEARRAGEEDDDEEEDEEEEGDEEEGGDEGETQWAREEGRHDHSALFFQS